MRTNSKLLYLLLPFALAILIYRGGTSFLPRFKSLTVTNQYAPQAVQEGALYNEALVSENKMELGDNTQATAPAASSFAMERDDIAVAEKTRQEGDLKSSVNRSIGQLDLSLAKVKSFDQPKADQAESFLNPNGYWENSYQPKPPTLPILVDRLNEQLKITAPYIGSLPSHGKLVKYTAPPPKRGALSLRATSVRESPGTPGRVFMQIEMASAQNLPNERAPYSLAVVIPDMKSLSHRDLNYIQEILLALENSRRADDRIAIYTNNSTIDFSNFSYGTLQAFFKTYDKYTAKNETTNLHTIYKQASTLTLKDRANEIRERIVLTLGHPAITEFNDQVYKVIDHHVLKGGTSHVITLVDHLSFIKLSTRGHGFYHLLDYNTPIKEQIRAQVANYGNTIARNLRLNIKLNNDVFLREIVLSRRLSDQEVQREKAIEIATDKLLAQQSGIASDRGSDDSGIQILIPRFLTNDHHIIILDLFVQQAGTLAEISLRAKDLVLMDNTTLLATAYLDHDQTNNETVSNNYYALKLIEKINQSRKLIQENQIIPAIVNLRHYSEEISKLAPAGEIKQFAIDYTEHLTSYLHNFQSPSNHISLAQKEAIDNTLVLSTDQIGK
jgi:hypothetical protein